MSGVIGFVVGRSAAIGLGSFAAALTGLAVAHALPAQVLADAKPIITSVMSLIAALLALVLGLLVWTAHGVFVNQQSEVYTLGNTINRLIFLLRTLGPEGAAGLAALREETGAIRRRFWGEKGVSEFYTYEMSRRDMEALEFTLCGLHAEGEAHKRIVASCLQLAATIVDTQLLMMRQMRNPTPALLLDAVTAWTVALFFGFGCNAVPSAASGVAAAVGAAAVSGAVFLILELQQPYSGFHTIRPNAIDALLAALAPVQEKTTALTSAAPVRALSADA